MAFQAGDISFRSDLRHIETVFRHADRANPFWQIVHDDPIRAFDPFPRVTVFHLLAGDVQRIAFHLNFRVRQSGVVFQQRQLVSDDRVLQDGVLRLRLIFRSRVIVIRWAQIVEVCPQRHAKHEGVAAFIAEVNVGPIGDAVNGADVKLALLLQLTREILLIIVAFILQFQAQRLPGRLILHPAKQRRWPVEHIAAVDGTGLFITVIAVTEFIAV